MKNRLINLIKISILLFGIPFLLINCNQEELDIVAAHEQGIKAQYQKQRITFNELQTKLNKYSNFGELQAKAGGNFITSLDLDNVIEFSSEEKTTYTMKANTVDESNSKTTNLIIEEQNDELTYYLMRYIPSLRYVLLNTTGNSTYIPFDGIVQLLSSDGTIITEKLVVNGVSQKYNQDCEINVEYILGDCSCPNDPSSEPHEATDCCEGPPIIGIIIDIDCPSGNSGNSNNNDNTGDGNPLGDGNTNTGGGTNNNDDTGNNNNNTSNEDIPQIPTEPIFGDTSGNDIASMFNEFLDSNNQITQSQIDWIYFSSENTIIGQQVYNSLYLGANSGQDYSNIDLDGIFNFLLQIGGEIGLGNTLTDTLNFNSIAEIEQFFSDMLDSPFLLISSTQETQSVRRDVHSLRINNFPQADIVSTVRIEVPGDDNGLLHPKILNMSTVLEGNNTFFEWTQLDSNDPEETNGPLVETFTNNGNNFIKVSVAGEIQIGIHFGSIDLRKRKLMTIIMYYDYTTGAFMNGHWEYTNP